MFPNELDRAVGCRVGKVVGVLDGVAEMNSSEDSALATLGFELGPGRDDVFEVFRRCQTFNEKYISFLCSINLIRNFRF